MVENCEFTESVPERFTTEENCVQGLSFVGYFSNFWYCEGLIFGYFRCKVCKRSFQISISEPDKDDVSVKNFVNVTSQKLRYPGKTNRLHEEKKKVLGNAKITNHNDNSRKSFPM